jgi:hypothetical protein
MVTNTELVRPRHEFDRRFFLAVAILFPVTVLIGFGQTFYLKPLFPSPPMARAIIPIHGALMTAWVALFVTQVYLISSRRIRVHQKLGYLGIVLAALIIITGTWLSIAAAKYGSIVTPPVASRLEFLIVPMGDLVAFAVLFGAALYYRKNAASHKRLILLTLLNFLPPAIARFPGGMTDAYGPLWFFGVPTILTVALIVIDTWRTGKLNKPFLFGGLFLIAAQWVRLPLSKSQVWLDLAAWMTQ